MGKCKECLEDLGGSASLTDYRNHFKICPAKAKGWICTDRDAKQYRKDISATKFEFKERGVYKVIDLGEYSEEELERIVIGYYDSLQVLKEVCGEDSNGIIAECVFEDLFAPPRAK